MARDKVSAKSKKTTFDSEEDKNTQRVTRQLKDAKFAYDKAIKAQEGLEKDIKRMKKELDKIQKEFDNL